MENMWHDLLNGLKVHIDCSKNSLTSSTKHVKLTSHFLPKLPFLHFFAIYHSILGDPGRWFYKSSHSSNLSLLHPSTGRDVLRFCFSVPPTWNMGPTRMGDASNQFWTSNLRVESTKPIYLGSQGWFRTLRFSFKVTLRAYHVWFTNLNMNRWHVWISIYTYIIYLCIYIYYDDDDDETHAYVKFMRHGSTLFVNSWWFFDHVWWPPVHWLEVVLRCQLLQAWGSPTLGPIERAKT